MRTAYVDPQVGARAAARLAQALAAGDYDGLQTAAFATRLTADLASVAHDKHLRIIALDATPKPDAAPEPVSDAGVVRADRLAGDVGYLEIIGFPPPNVFKPALDRAMAALAGTRALVVDMRRNGGGDPDGVAYLVGYFVGPEARVHVMDLLTRTPGTNDYTTQATFTSPTPTSYLHKPVYVLTSGDTFSGGEEFCYDMHNQKLAVLVGQTTGGGANPGDERAVGPNLIMFVPTGKARSPITGGAWEGVGVAPDIAAPAGDALKVALTRLGQSPRSGDIAALSQARLFQMRTAPRPGAEAALRRMIETQAAGHPDYSQLSPDFAQAVRSQLPAIQPRLAGLGPITGIVFRGPAMYGDDFLVRFAKGSQLWSLSLADDGKIDGAVFRPAPAAPAASRAGG